MNSVLFVAGVDPNIATDETRKIPVLFAAERGHYEVLRVFKRHNYEQSVLPGKIFKMVRFDKWTRYKDETVLHLALKRSLLGLHQVRCSKIQRINGERICIVSIIKRHIRIDMYIHGQCFYLVSG